MQVVGKLEFDAKSRGRTYVTYQRNFKKMFNIPVFLHHVNVRKHVHIIPHLRKRKIEKQR